MTTREVEKLKSRRKDLLEKLSRAPYWIHGSVVESTREQSGKTKPFCYLSKSSEGKNSITYIAVKDLERFRQAASEGAKVRILLAEISDITVKLLKAGEYSG